jgi:hypothetical protein
MKSFFIFSLLSFCLGLKLFSQDSDRVFTSHAFIDHPLDNFALKDSSTEKRFIVDSAQVNITCFDTRGNKIWHTDPWKDNGLTAYRTNRPKIVSFTFANNRWTYYKAVIWIIYNNTQFGFLDKESGQFTFLGQM